MTQEIIYTSAPSGLKPGSRGFCTVVATRGLAKPLADQLEDLSGYRHLFVSNDANSALNPIVFSHLKLSIAGRTYHVLSRISDAGLDYTQRTNKLAHHIALEPRELTSAGPAALLSAPAFMTTSWSGEPTIRESGPVPPRVDIAPGICGEWGRLTGDPGWGGYIAEALVADARKQIVLVYRPGTNVLTLVAETLALLPANRRWDVTFCTYFTKLPPTVDCRWRCVVDGTPEAETLARSPTAIVVDLRKPLVPPAGSPYVSAARTGIPVQLAAAPSLPIRSPGATAQPDQDDLLLAALGATSADDSNNPQRRHDQRNPEPSHLAQAYGLAPPPISHDAIRRNEALRIGAMKRTPTRSLRPIVLLSIGMVALLAIGGLGTYLYSIIAATPQDAASNKTSTPQQGPTAPEGGTLAAPLPSVTSTATSSSSSPGATPSEAAKPPPPDATSVKVTQPPKIPDATLSAPRPIASPTTPKSEANHNPNPAPSPTTTAAVSSRKSEAIAPILNRSTPDKPTESYFPIAAIGPSTSTLGSVQTGSGHTITVFLNDANNGRLKVISKDATAKIVHTADPRSVTPEQTVAEFSIERANGPISSLRFHGKSFLTPDILSLLQTSLVDVTSVVPDGASTFHRFAPKPNPAEAFTLFSLLQSNKKLKPFVRPDGASLRFQVWIEMANRSQQRISLADKETLLLINVTNTLNVPMRITFLDNPEKSFDIKMELDIDKFRRDFQTVSDALFPADGRQRQLNNVMMDNAKEKMKSLVATSTAENQRLGEAYKAVPSKDNQAALRKSTSELEQLTLASNDLNELSVLYDSIRDPNTSKNYRLHYEISSKAGAHYLTLTSTTSEAFK